MKGAKKISIVVPAYNEEENIKDVVKSLVKVLPRYCGAYEIIIIDDASTDATSKIIDALAIKNKHIRPIHNKTSKGFGGSYWTGVNLARHEYCMMVWGDNGHTEKSLIDILSNLGKYEVVIPNYINVETRTPARRFISKAFTALVNLITGLRVDYYNGTTLYKTKLLKTLRRRSSGFGFQAEVLVMVLKNGVSFLQVQTLRTSVLDGPTAAFKVKNIISVIKSLCFLFKISWLI